jgi:hypothetical protein
MSQEIIFLDTQNGFFSYDSDKSEVSFYHKGKETHKLMMKPKVDHNQSTYYQVKILYFNGDILCSPPYGEQGIEYRQFETLQGAIDSSEIAVKNLDTDSFACITTDQLYHGYEIRMVQEQQIRLLTRKPDPYTVPKCVKHSSDRRVVEPDFYAREQGIQKAYRGFQGV